MSSNGSTECCCIYHKSTHIVSPKVLLVCMSQNRERHRDNALETANTLFSLPVMLLLVMLLHVNAYYSKLLPCLLIHDRKKGVLAVWHVKGHVTLQYIWYRSEPHNLCITVQRYNPISPASSFQN